MAARKSTIRNRYLIFRDELRVEKLRPVAGARVGEKASRKKHRITDQGVEVLDGFKCEKKVDLLPGVRARAGDSGTKLSSVGGKNAVGGLRQKEQVVIDRSLKKRNGFRRKSQLEIVEILPRK